MKTKKILIVAAALTVLAACSSDDSPVDSPIVNAEQRVPVTLAYTTIDAVETRAAQNLNEGTFDSGESVRVRISNTGEDTWAEYPFFTAADGAMTATDPAPYYPAGNQNIDIVAYYPGTAWDSFTVYADQTDDADYKASDLLFASVTNQAKQAEAVNLAFTHKMAKLNVNITAGAGVGSITSVSILGVKPTVSFDRATGGVGEATGTATTIAVSNNGAALIPPQTITGGLLSIVTDKGTATYSVNNKAFAAGQLYTLNITVNLRAVGTTTAITGWTSEGTVTVNPVQRTPYGLEAVDLGLSVKWANMNVGATSETDYGTYFAWGETAGYTVIGSTTTAADGNVKSVSQFDWEHYSLCNGSSGTLIKYNTNASYGLVDNKTELEHVHDAARVNWGADWRMPTQAEMEELKNTRTNTTDYTWTWCDGINTKYDNTSVAGYMIESKKEGTAGNHIFLPATGVILGGEHLISGSVCYYWSSMLTAQSPYTGKHFRFDDEYLFIGNGERCDGMSVRAVTE